jgi:hypothetical protein
MACAIMNCAIMNCAHRKPPSPDKHPAEAGISGSDHPHH